MQLSPMLMASIGIAALGLLVVVGLRLSDRRRDDTEPRDGPNTSASETAADGVDAIRERSFLTGLKGVFHTLAVAPLAIMTPLVRALPATWRLYHKLHLWSGYQMQRASSADALANVRFPNDKEDVLPANWEEGGEKEKAGTGWKVLGCGNKRYDPSVRGGTSSKLGKANLIHINEDDTEQGSWTEAAMDAAFQLDRERYLFRDADVNVDYEMVYQGAQGQQMRADGGEVGGQWEPKAMHASIERPGVLHDTLVPLTSREGYDGQVISWNQYQSVKQEQADQETVRDAKNQAWTAAKLEDVDGMNVLKWALIIGIWSFILLFHQDIGAAIASFGGGEAVGDAASGTGLGMISLGVV